MKRIVRRFLSLFTHRRDERDLAREMTSHLALLEDEYRRRGMRDDDARLAARRAMGSIAHAKDLHRDARSFIWLDDAHRDVVHAVRTLLGNPGFALAVVLTLALGIGASTAIFSVAYGVSLRPLSYPQPDRLVRIYEANPASGEWKQDVSDAAFQAWREGASSIEAAALYAKSATRFLAGSQDQTATTMSVSPAFFDVLGVRPFLGEGFKAEKDYTRFTADDEAILSYAAWRRFFGGRRDVIGRSMEFSGIGDNDVYRIVGVMPEGFAYGEPVDLWRPANIIELPIRPVALNWRYDRVVARLAPGATIDTLRGELDVLSARLGRQYPARNAGWTTTVETLHESVIGNFGRGSWLLLAAVALVLLAWYGVSTLKAIAPPGIPRLDAIAIDGRSLIAALICTVTAVVSFTVASLERRRRELIDRLRASSIYAGESRAHQSTRRAIRRAVVPGGSGDSARCRLRCRVRACASRDTHRSGGGVEK